MTKKDIELIASHIRWGRDLPGYSDSELAIINEGLGDIAVGLAEAFKDANPSFDYTKFLKACGYVEN